MVSIFFCIYMLCIGYLAAILLRKFFAIEHGGVSMILGMFLVLVMCGWFGGVMLLLMPWNSVAFGSILLAVGVLHMPGLWYVKRKITTEMNETPAAVISSWSVIGLLLFIIIEVVCFALLSSSRVTGIIMSPWQVIDPRYIFVFFVATVLLGFLIFSSFKARAILLLLVVHTFLLHSYLAFSHVLPYGADGWRHIANQQQFINGGMFTEAKLAGAATNRLTSIIGQLSYGNFWAIQIMLSTVFGSDFIQMARWFMPVLWSVVFPLLLFEIARTLGLKEKQALAISWFGLLPFAWQTAGSFSLPVNFGFLIFLLGLLLVIKRITRPQSGQVLLLAIYGVGMLSGYSLYVILFWSCWIAAEVMVRLRVRYGLLSGFCVALIGVPAIELLAKYSVVDTALDWLGQSKQLIGNFLGVYVASGPRPHDILFGNIIFNQVPLNAFVSNLFVVQRWWIVVFMIGFFGVAVYGVKKILQTHNQAFRFMAVWSMGIVGAYVCANYFLGGEHLLARRLDTIVAFACVFLFGFGAVTIMHRRTVKVFFILFFSIAITGSYSLGPDSYTASTDQYEAAQYIWNQEKNTVIPCVLADTYTLLALEAVSAKHIIGGGFPIDAHFGQPERVELLTYMNNGVNKSLLDNISTLTDAEHCWVVGKTDFLQKQQLDNLTIFNTISTVKLQLIH